MRQQTIIEGLLMLLSPELFRPFIERFNADDVETKINAISNANAWEWLAGRIPRFECPDPVMQAVYYFRWWSFRKHFRQTPEGWVITEFLPDVSWAHAHNTIPCASAFSFNEGRWLRDPEILRDFARFWFEGDGRLHYMTFWAANACRSFADVHGEAADVSRLLYYMVECHARWDELHRDPCGLFWILDTPSVEAGIAGDGMEYSLGGSGCRPTINSYMFADALAIAAFADEHGHTSLAAEFRAKAEELRALVHELLWDEEAQFFKTLTTEAGQNAHWQVGGYAQKRARLREHTPGHLADVRELAGYIPWCFNLPRPGYEGGWAQLDDVDGFFGSYGPTTCERRHPLFMRNYGHDCHWNGPSWPFATTQTLQAMANVLHHYDQRVVSRMDYLRLLQTYARSHRRHTGDGRALWWIDENLHPDTGEWIARTLVQQRQPGFERGKNYNHSAFCDLVISGLCGVMPGPHELRIDPLLPPHTWPWFCLDGVPWQGHEVTIAYDEDGSRYGKGAGLRVWLDGELAGEAPALTSLTVSSKAST